MKYFKHNSIPLVEEFPGTKDCSFDEYGNYVEFGVFEEPTIITPTVLNDGYKIFEYEKQNFLKAYWALMNKKISDKNAVPDKPEE